MRRTEPDAAAAIAAVFDEDRAAEPPRMRSVLVVRGLTKSFGETRAVDGIDLTIPAGTFYGLVGPNGAGKTTTLSMIAGLLRPDRGSIDGQRRGRGIPSVEAKRMMGVLPDRLRTFDRLTGRQLLYYYGVLRRSASRRRGEPHGTTSRARSTSPTPSGGSSRTTRRAWRRRSCSRAR